jgi:glutathione S-transferase
MAILVSNMRCEIREVDLSEKPADMLMASPKGTVPVLVLPDGRVLEESLQIMSFALELNDPDNWLCVSDDGLEWIKTNDGPFKTHLDRYKYPSRYEVNGSDHREAGLKILQTLDQRLSAHAYLEGTHITLIDVATFPFVRQFANVNEAWFNAQDLPRLQAWLLAWVKSDIFAKAMTPLAPWQLGDDTTAFPPLS